MLDQSAVPSISTDQTSVLLIAHGSRKAAANLDLVKLAEQVKERGGYQRVAVSYLELAEPTIPDAARQCVAEGATQVLMMPYFLSAGVHVVEDLEEHRANLSAEFPHVSFELRPHLGLHPLMIEVVLDRLGTAV